MNKNRLRANRLELQKYLKVARQQAGLRQGAVAQALGRPQSYVSKYECGERRLDLAELIDICRVLAISPIELISIVEKEAL